MASLPDGATVTQQVAEGWNVSLPAFSGIYAEGWNAELLVMGAFDLDADPVDLKVDEAVTFTGTSLRRDGLPAPVDISIDRPDGTTESVPADVASDGSFTASYTAEVGGEHVAQGTNGIAGIRQTEPWNATSPLAFGLQATEGWENT